MWETFGWIAAIAVVLWLVFGWNPRWPTLERIKAREEEERRTRPDLWCVPSMEGGAASFGQAVNLHAGTNGRYDRFTGEWTEQEKPGLNDLVIILTMDSAQGVIVNSDTRGRVYSISHSEGWKQPRVEVQFDVDGDAPQRQHFPLSEVLKTGMDRVWVTAR